MQLLVKSQTSLSEIKEIISHPMALAQSQLFLADNDSITVTEYKDTASCAKLVSEDTSGKLAVIGGPTLAKSYNLQVLIDNVCDVKQNYTRFYILSKGIDYVSNPNKASVTIKVLNEPGKLSVVLDVIKKYELNLSKIQSLPIPNESNVYPFHMDIEFEEKNIFEKCISNLKLETMDLNVLGVYKSEYNKPKPINSINNLENLN